MNTVMIRKLRYFGRIMRGNKYKILKLMIQRKINEKKGCERTPTS